MSTTSCVVTSATAVAVDDVLCGAGFSDPGWRRRRQNRRDAAGRIALFLDGLDEMPTSLRAKVLQIIDEDTQGVHLVMTSRPTEFEAALRNGRLYLYGAAVIDVLPVEVDQAEEFLLAEQLPSQRSRWQHVTSELRRHSDSPAARTLTTPLARSLARVTYAEADPEDLLNNRQHSTPDARG
jgi:hypothetical protein